MPLPQCLGKLILMLISTRSAQGISLPMDQFNTIINLLPHIETALASKGESIERPDYSGAGASAAVDADEAMEEREAEAKKNFEQTSDEGE